MGNEQTLEAMAEECADETSRDDLEGDEQAIFKDGVEFGFKRGAQSRQPEVDRLSGHLERIRHYFEDGKTPSKPECQVVLGHIAKALTQSAEKEE